MPKSAATVPSGFRDELVWSGLSAPTVVAFAPNGKVFVAQKNGRINVYDSLTDSSATLFMDLSSDVFNYWDRGLLGFTVDPWLPGPPVRLRAVHLRPHPGLIRGRATLGDRVAVRRLPYPARRQHGRLHGLRSAGAPDRRLERDRQTACRRARP